MVKKSLSLLAPDSRLVISNLIAANFKIGTGVKMRPTDIAEKVREVARRYPELHPYTISLKMEVLFGIKVGSKRIKQILNGDEV